MILPISKTKYYFSGDIYSDVWKILININFCFIGIKTKSYFFNMSKNFEYSTFF